ncbi:hypothetical protein FAEUMB_24990 [Faecalimonas umbilicata]|uniref:Uncharacterized protein n=1 Tax=Faecalimonas umbilicata TaxID=1912855 RepID=A0ABQ0QZZ7_9FIRM|nr:hypothetical protein [Faecalimonas umbilicata]GBU05958.1 hypothetical protein FAEUMB_24990 [Faecalimonas umbilicata]
MRRKHRLKELTIKDNFMFGAVMMDENTKVCKGRPCRKYLMIPMWNSCRILSTRSREAGKWRCAL